MLKKKCSDKHILAISQRVEDWEVYAPYLCLRGDEIESIKADHGKHKVKSHGAFTKWKEKFGFKAKYHYLVKNVFLESGNAELAEFVCRLLISPAS